MEKFTVTLNHHAHYGYVEYDPETKTASVVLDVPEAKARVEEFLMPLDSLENFKNCLGRLWFNTDVRVEWSMPPGAMDNL